MHEAALPLPVPTISRSLQNRLAGSLLALAALTALPAASATLSGCTPAASPVTVAIAIAQGIVDTATTVVADAQAVWPVVLASIPATAQAQAQADFNQAVLTTNHCILVLEDAIAAAVAASTTNPDFGTVFNDLSNAVGQIIQIVDQFSNGTTSTQVKTKSGIDALSDLHKSAARLQAATKK